MDLSLETFILKSTPTLDNMDKPSTRKIVIKWSSSFNFVEKSTNIKSSTLKKDNKEDFNHSTWGNPSKYIENLTSLKYKEPKKPIQQLNQKKIKPLDYISDYMDCKNSMRSHPKPVKDFADLSAIKKPLTKLWHGKPVPALLRNFDEPLDETKVSSLKFSKFAFDSAPQYTTACFREKINAAKMVQKDFYEFVSKKYDGISISKDKSVDFLSASMESTNLTKFKSKKKNYKEDSTFPTQKVMLTNQTDKNFLITTNDSMSSKKVDVRVSKVF